MKRAHPRNQLRVLRSILGLRQREAAEALGIAADTLGRYEAGTRRVTPELERKVASIFGVDPTSLYSALKDQWGQPYSRISWEAWKLLPESQRQEVIDIETLLAAEVRRLFEAARMKGQSSTWVPQMFQMLRAMADELGERPPTRVFAFDEPITLVPKSPGHFDTSPK